MTTTKESRIREVLDQIVELFKTGDVPKTISIAIFPPYAGIPSSSWSLLNRIIMLKNDTLDSRGYRQWRKAGRHVKKGEKSFCIFAPKIVKKTIEKTNEVTGEVEEVEKKVIVGYIPIPVFAIEATEGADVEYEPIQLPQLPLMEKAKEWGISVEGVTFLGLYYGCYEKRGDSERIRLATPSEKVWLHELAHAAHNRVKGGLKPQQDPIQEVVAELSAQVLAELVGTQLHDTRGNAYQYIRHYANDLGKSVGQICMEVIGETEKVLKLILEP